MITKTSEDRAYNCIRERIAKTIPSERFHEEASLINWAIGAYTKLGRMDDFQRRELSNMLLEKSAEYAAIKANERLLEKMRIRKMLKSGYSHHPYN